MWEVATTLGVGEEELGLLKLRHLRTKGELPRG